MRKADQIKTAGSCPPQTNDRRRSPQTGARSPPNVRWSSWRSWSMTSRTSKATNPTSNTSVQGPVWRSWRCQELWLISSAISLSQRWLLANVSVSRLWLTRRASGEYSTLSKDAACVLEGTISIALVAAKDNDCYLLRGTTDPRRLARTSWIMAIWQRAWGTPSWYLHSFGYTESPASPD